MSRLPTRRTRYVREDKCFTWADGVAIALLCVLTLAFYRQIALTNLILSGVDAFTYFYPYRDYAAEALRNGQIPLWNPYLFLGVPFLANAQTAVFYPLNLALCWLPAPKLIAWSIVLHVALAAVFAYLYARRALKLSPIPAFLSASAFAFGGFLSGQVEHVNQLNVSAWFPLLLLLWELRREGRWSVARGCLLLATGTVIGVGLLAGHAQSSYISLVGLGVYALLPTLLDLWRVLLARRKLRGQKELQANMFARPKAPWAPTWQRFRDTFLELGFVGLIGVGLAAVQILPTIELSRLSIRSGGLSYREAVAFSLKPLPHLLRYTFLPPWGHNLADVFGGDFFTEYLAYIGVIPLLLVVVWLGSWVAKLCVAWWLGSDRYSLCEMHIKNPRLRMFVLAGLGIFVALGLYNPLYFVLYKIVPGFTLFRVPARWLFLYAFGIAMLAGMGLERGFTLFRVPVHRWLDHKGNHRESPLPWKWARPAIEAGVVMIALGELFAASQALPLNHLTAPEAYSSLRTAPAHLLAAQQQEIAPGRFLSMSDTTFDPGDLDETVHMFQGQLPERALYDAVYAYVVCAKRKEIMAPNLPLAWRIYAVDGYDGGVLPLARYVRLQHLFLDEIALSSDGRLYEQISSIPPSRLLSLLGVRYVISDKVHDVWMGDVFYDLAFDAVLNGEGETVATNDIPRFAATALGVVSYLEGEQASTEGVPVAKVRLTTEQGDTHSFVLCAGQDTGKRIKGEHGHMTQLRWKDPTPITRIEIAALPFAGHIHVQGLTLIDERDGSNAPIILSTTGRFRQVHSGDVKIYEVLDALPRAYVVHQTRVIGKDRKALAAMADPTHDPAQTAILSSGREIDASPNSDSQVTVTAYAPEAIALRASLPGGAPGYLVLSDAWYPGWKATVDGEPATIERANVHFRAVYLDEGTHTVRFTYWPTSYFVGLGISMVTLVSMAIGIVIKTSKLANRGY